MDFSAGKEATFDEKGRVVLPADFISRPLALACVRRFLVTSFSNLPRHIERLEKLIAIERLQNV